MGLSPYSTCPPKAVSVMNFVPFLPQAGMRLFKETDEAGVEPAGRKAVEWPIWAGGRFLLTTVALFAHVNQGESKVTPDLALI